MTERNYIVDTTQRYPIKMWTKGVPVEDSAVQQLHNVANLPFIHSHLAVMPDVHFGIGATVGSVIPTDKAIVPASVGVDIGCGMAAVKLHGLTVEHLPDTLNHLRGDIERDVPTGFNAHGEGRINTKVVTPMIESFTKFLKDFGHDRIGSNRKDPLEKIIATQYGTLGGGNHFLEICFDQNKELWLMLHSGSRGIGNLIGQYFIELAKADMRVHHINLPDQNLAYLSEGTKYFDDYVFAVNWAQEYAMGNRTEMLRRALIKLHRNLPPFREREMVVNCHHNYISREHHFGKDVWITRKGAIRAGEGEYGIIPGSMGAQSFIVRGKGNKDSFCTCSHGAGRAMSRAEAKRRFTLDDHKKATEGVECRKDHGVIDETPAAYKDIVQVMKAQEDLVEIVYTLKQVLCIKG